MNWIQRLYEIKQKDFYSQNGEGLIIESILLNLHDGSNTEYSVQRKCIDIGCGPDGMYLSNTRHMKLHGWKIRHLDLTIGHNVMIDTVEDLVSGYLDSDFVSIDIDGNDFWVIDKMLKFMRPPLIVAEFNAMYTDSRAIKYNPDHVWDGDSYYGFTFKAGEKLAELNGYKVIFQLADMNMFMVRADLIEGLEIPPVTYKQNNFFKLSDRMDWITI